MKKEKKFNIYKLVFYTFLISYSIIYFGYRTGYYEIQNYKKKSLTEEQIKKFEEDVANGKEIDINEYLVKDDIHYRNNLSTFTSKLSDNISYIVKSGVEATFKYLSKAIEEK